MNRLFFSLTVVFFTSFAFAAKFEKVQELESETAQALYSAGKVITANQGAFGDAGSVTVYSFEKDADEPDHNTIKQMSFAFGGATTDDTQRDFAKSSVRTIVTYALKAVDDTEDDAAMDAATEALVKAVTAIKADPKLQLFGSGHADEDGSWQILYVLDKENKQILMVKIGYNGT